MKNLPISVSVYVCIRAYLPENIPVTDTKSDDVGYLSLFAFLALVSDSL